MSTKKIESKNLDKHFFARFPLDAFDASFKDLEDCLFLLLIILLIMITMPLTIQFLKTITENIFFQSKYYQYNVLIDGRNFYDADSWAIQQSANSQVCAVLEKSNETVLQFSKGTAKVL